MTAPARQSPRRRCESLSECQLGPEEGCGNALAVAGPQVGVRGVDPKVEEQVITASDDESASRSENRCMHSEGIFLEEEERETNPPPTLPISSVPSSVPSVEISQ